VSRSQSCGPTTRAQSATNLGILLPPLVTTSRRRVNQVVVTQGTNIGAPIPPRNYANWNTGSPLILPVPPTTWDPIPPNALKALPKFSGEDFKTHGEHLQDVFDVCVVHVIIEHSVAIRLLVASFKGLGGIGSQVVGGTGRMRGLPVFQFA